MQPKTLDHVAFWLADREPISETLISRYGMHVIDRQDNFTLIGADARRGKLTLFDAEGPREPGAFKHVALLVDSVDEHIAEAEEMGVVDNVVDAANTRAVFVWGPERVRIEYVEHKPEFALT